MTWRGVTWRGVLVAMAMAGLLAGCGGGGGLEKGQFVAQAEAKCKAVLDLFPTERAEAGESPAESAERNRRSSEFYRRLHTDLKDLKPPDELRADFRQYLEKTDRQAKNREEIAAATTTRDTARFQALADEFKAVNETKRNLRPKLGFKTC